MKKICLTLVTLFLYSCTVHQSDGRKCIQDATSTCQLDQLAASSLLKEKGFNHCNYTEKEINLWRMQSLNIPQEYEDLNAKAWINDHQTRDQKFLSLTVHNKNCLFETEEAQTDLIHLLDQSDEL